MSTKKTLLIGITVIGLAVGANQALEPKTLEELNQQRQQQNVEDLSDAQERSDDNKRDAADDYMNAENRRLTPAEERPQPRLRWRP